MNLIKLRQIKKFYFGYEELARVLGIRTDSARVTASRYVKMGILLRIKRNLYVLRDTWQAATKEDKFMVANLAEAPSYISLATALDYHEITTQLQRDFFESIAVQRTKTISVEKTVFRYSKISLDLYFGFEKKGGFFIASPEKAILDAGYLTSFGRYSLDFAAIDPKSVNMRKISELSRPYPQRTQKLLRIHGLFPTA